MHKTNWLMVTVISGLVWMSSSAGLAQTGSSAPPEMPPAREIPGINVEDQFPGACVDCHINYTDMNLDTRFSTLMTQWSEEVEPRVLEIAKAVSGPDLQLTGVHPRIDTELNDIPDGCLSCHQRSGDDVVPLVPLLHRIHLDGSVGDVFLRVFQGECTHCHKLDRTTGQWRVPSGPER